MTPTNTWQAGDTTEEMNDPQTSNDGDEYSDVLELAHVAPPVGWKNPFRAYSAG